MTKLLRTLIIDDSAEEADSLIRGLRREGYDVSAERTDTKEGLAAALQDETWDIVLCEFDMPRISGLDALKIVRGHSPDVPFLFVSGATGAEAADAVMRAGALCHGLKDSPKRVVAAIERELREAEAEQHPMDAPRGEAASDANGAAAALMQAEIDKIDAVVLVVEDNADVRKIVCRLLRDFGCAVMEASSGAAALQALQSNRRIDLMFTDMVMPGGMSGAELVEAARGLRPGIKTLLTTGFAEASLRNQVQFAHLGEVLTKPYRRQDLARKIRSALGPAS